MNIKQWLMPLLRMRQPKKSNGKGMIWASIITLVVSFFALRRLKNEHGTVEGKSLIGKDGASDSRSSITDLLSGKDGEVGIQQFLTMNDRQVLAEISDELTPKSQNDSISELRHENNIDNVDHNFKL